MPMGTSIFINVTLAGGRVMMEKEFHFVQFNLTTKLTKAYTLSYDT